MSYIQDNFKNWTPLIRKYANKRLAIVYVSYGEHGQEDECVATINLPDIKLDVDEVIIKNYSENDGIYQLMVNAGHISESIRTVSSGFILAPVCKILIK